MSEKEILDRLWDTHHETPFASFTLERKLDLSKDQYQRVLNLLGDMSDSGEPKNGYRIKRVASTVYKMIASKQGDSETAKGLPLTDANESLTGQNSEGFSVGLSKNGNGEDCTQKNCGKGGVESLLLLC